MSTITIKNLKKKFGTKLAVNDCSIVFEKGKIYGLLGPNGSGKTTVMKMIAGLYKPTKGSIMINDIPISYLSKADVAFMSTENFMYSHMKISNVSEYFCDFYMDFDKEKFEILISEFALEMDMKVGELSSGMNAKLQVAATIARKASVIMLDEPLNGIDLVARDQILNAIIQHATEDNTFIISSHLVDQMEPILDEVIFIKEGQFIIEGDAETLRIERQKSIVDIYREVFAC